MVLCAVHINESLKNDWDKIPGKKCLWKKLPMIVDRLTSGSFMGGGGYIPPLHFFLYTFLICDIIYVLYILPSVPA